MKANSGKRNKALKFVALALVAVIVIAGIAVARDYNSYQQGERSLLFGTLDTYTQNQTLKFGNLNLQATRVSLKAYKPPTQPPVMNCGVEPKSSPSESIEGLFNTQRHYNDCNSALESYGHALEHSKDKNELVVTFSYSNISDHPLDLSSYHTSLVANAPLAAPSYSQMSCFGMATSNLLKGGSAIACLAMDIDKGYSGPLSLIVTSGGKEKEITLQIPTTS